MIGLVVEAVRPSRPSGRGVSWQVCEAERDRIKEWLKQDLEVTKIHDLLERRGLKVPYRTLHRFAAEELGYRRAASTVPVVDGEPGEELQIDFGRMGLMFDPHTDRRRVVWALIFTAVVSRHTLAQEASNQRPLPLPATCHRAVRTLARRAAFRSGEYAPS